MRRREEIIRAIVRDFVQAVRLPEVRGSERRVDLLLRGVADEIVRDRETICAVGDDGNLDRSDLVAIEARRLLARQRCGGMSPRKFKRRKCACGGNCRAAGENMASVEFGHSSPPDKSRFQKSARYRSDCAGRQPRMLDQIRLPL